MPESTPQTATEPEALSVETTNPGGADVPAGKGQGRRNTIRWIGRYGTIAGLVLMIVYFAIVSDPFLTTRNILNILSASALLGIISAGLTVTLVLFEFDLSIGWVATAAGMFTAGVAVDEGTLIGIVAGLVVGLVVGLLNGLIVTRLNVHALIATLAMGTILQGVIFGYRGGAQISGGLPSNFPFLGRERLIGVQLTVWIMVAVMVVLWAMLRHMPIGRKMYAVGGNATAARLSGIAIDRIRVVAFVVSGLLAALTGVLLASNLDAGNPTAGLGFLLDAFTACFIGAATLRDGEFHIPGTLIGVLILGVLQNGLVLTGVSASYQTVVRGTVLISAVALSGLMRRATER